MKIDLTAQDLQLISWAMSTATNALVMEQEKDEPALSEKSATIMVRKLHTLDSKLADFYDKMGEASED